VSYVRVSILGTGIGGEAWSINPTYDPSGEFGSTVDQTALDAACLAIANRTPGGTAGSIISTAMSIVGARLEVRDDASDELIGISTQGRPTPYTGGIAPKMPLQNAAVVSLRTNTPGASGRGRLYWPVPGLAVASNTRIATADVTSILGSLKTYLVDIRDSLSSNFPTIGFNLAVRSKTTHSTPHVVRIQMGDVIDTQRRRRDKLVEAYSSLSFP
jgi:hypothetical protein